MSSVSDSQMQQEAFSKQTATQPKENDCPNTPEQGDAAKRSRWEQANASTLEQVRAVTTAPTPMADKTRAQMPGVPSTPLMDSRARVTAQTPGGVSLVFGTPAKFHASPAGRKSSTAVLKSVQKAAREAPRTAPRKKRAEVTRLTQTAVKAKQPQNVASPPRHPNPARPIAAEAKHGVTPTGSPAPVADVNRKLEPSTPQPSDASDALDELAVRSGKVANAIINAQEQDDDELVNTPYIKDRLQAALARNAELVATPIADATPMAKKFNGTRAELLEKLAELDRELALTQQRHAALVESIGNGTAVSIVDGKAWEKDRQAHAQEIVALKNEIMQYKRLLVEKDSELSTAHAEIREQEAKVGELEDANQGFKDVASGYQRQCKDQEKHIDALRNEIEEQKARISKLLEQAKHDMTVRRRLNNEIQELKGNIRVYCRVRPLMSKEKSNPDQAHRISFPNDESIRVSTVERSNIGRGDKRKEWNFQFNRTFTMKSTQNEIFDEIGGLVQSALDGFNVCVFAYGQTGAGKTYTMEGPNVTDMDDWSKGVIPRAVEQIFEYASQQSEFAWSYEIETSFVEIYLDEVYDLLATATGTERSVMRDKLAVRQQRDGSVEIAGLTVESVSKPEQVYDLLQRAAGHRATAATLKNDRSSRSHSVFQMKLSGTNLETGKTTTGCLNLVDLAGSERVAKSGATGEQLKEAQAINKSLSTLGDVIRAVAEGSQHVPYRNSKLTRLLEPYFGGNSKTLMFVNVSPNTKDMSETISSLRFAEQVGSCVLGKVTKNK